MTTQISAGWHDDPVGRFERRYYDGTEWTNRVSSAGVDIDDPEPMPTRAEAPPAALAVQTSGLSDAKRQRMGIVAMASGGALVLGMLLPWATSSAGSLSGIGAGLGVVTAICGVVIGLYGAQIFRPGVIRYHPGALAAIIISDTVSLSAFSLLEDLDTVTLGVANVNPGIGLFLTFIAGLVAIWPLVVFWRDYRRQRAALRAPLAQPALGQPRA